METEKSPTRDFPMIAKTFRGLEEVLARELTELGANNVEIGRRMVSFTGDKEMMYKANFCLRTAIRVLKPIHNFTAKDADEVYEQVKAMHWEDYLSVDSTFAVDAVVYSEVFRHSKFVAYRVKDAIADYFREKTGRRPGVRVNNPDILLHIHIADTDCSLSLDSSGESLHRRGYRQESVEAPLNEVLAAGLVMLTGWQGESDLIDPMCGSGTIAIEAALIARNIAPGVFRQSYAFERWADFDRDLLDEIYNDDSRERPFEHKVYAYDNSPKACGIATRNIKAAGVSKDVVLKLQDFKDFTRPEQKAILITNPPYGERLAPADIMELYEMIGERLKHAFVGGSAWILSYHDDCFNQIGLKPTRRIELNNGALECEFRQYEIFNGRYKDFRAEGEELSKATRQQDSPRREGGYAARRDYRPGERRESGDYGYRRRESGDRYENRRRYADEQRNGYYDNGRPRSGESYPERRRREQRAEERNSRYEDNKE